MTAGRFRRPSFARAQGRAKRGYRSRAEAGCRVRSLRCETKVVIIQGAETQKCRLLFETRIRFPFGAAKGLRVASFSF